MLIVSKAWKVGFPGAVVGTLVMRGVANPEVHPALEQRKQELESELRSRFRDQDRAALKTLEPIQAYNAHYKRYKKTYHIQLQLESVALKGKPIPHVAALVEAMFIAELKNLLLTAGHDMDAVREPVKLDVSTGTEHYLLLNGHEQVLAPGDMMMADSQGVISSVLHGPDRRTRLTPHTRRVFFAVYAPPGIGARAMRQHLQDIQANVTLVAPEAEVESLNVYDTE